MTSNLRLLCFLLLQVYAVSGQNFWAPLSGPPAAPDISAIQADGAGRLFMVGGHKVFCSPDSGLHWNPCMMGLPPADLLMGWQLLPSPTDDFYLRSLENGAVYRYDSASASWTAVLSVPIQNMANCVGINPQGRIWASGNVDGPDKMYYSDDNGQSAFQEVLLTSELGEKVIAIEPFDTAHNLCVSQSGNINRLYHFTQTGVVKQVLDFEVRYAGYNSYTGTAFCSGGFHEFKRSTDGGLNWEDMAVNPVTNAERYFTRMFFDPGGTIWAYAGNSLYQSLDDGVNWTLYAPFMALQGPFFRPLPGVWFRTVYGSFFRSADSGLSWQDLTDQFLQPSVWDIQMGTTGTLYAFSSRYFAFEKSHDGGQTWAPLVLTDSAKTAVGSLAIRASDGLMLGVGKNAQLYRSTDNGASWEPIANPANLQSGYYRVLYAAYDGTFYWIDRGSGEVYKSTDNGDNWQQVDLFTLAQVQLAFHPNGDVYYVNPNFYELRHFCSATGIDTVISNLSTDGLTPQQVHCTATGVVLFCGDNGMKLYRLYVDSGTPEILPNAPFPVFAITSNAAGHIFVIGHHNLYKSKDNGLSWEDLGPMPTEYTNVLYVGNDQHLYVGISDGVMYRSQQPLSESNLIFAKTWNDADNDCQPDADEPFPNNLKITASGASDHVGFVGSNGEARISAPAGDYKMNIQAPNALFTACFSDLPVTLIGYNDTAEAYLPLSSVVLCPYLRVSLSTSVLHYCSDNTYIIHYRNEGTALANGATVEVTLDSFFLYWSATKPLIAQNGLVYTFQLGDLAPGQEGSFSISFELSCDAPYGYEHCIAAHIFPDQLCLSSLPPLATTQECRGNVGPYDPNEKRAFVNGKENPGTVAPGIPIEYLISFQNTGTATARRVVVEDFISPSLNLASFTALVSSHPLRIEMKDQRTVRFVFDDIFLPDSNANEQASHGFLKFSLSPIPTLSPGTIIANQANILFDYNAPVATNTSTLMVAGLNAAQSASLQYTLLLSPNPFREALIFQVIGLQNSGAPLSLRLFDAQGRLMCRETFRGNTFTLPRSGLEKGLYFYLIEICGKQVAVGKVVAD